MRKNVGTLDAMIRLLLGWTGLAWGISRMTRDPYRITFLLVTIMSAQKIAEGLIRYCPVLGALGLSTRETDNEKAPYRIENFARKNIRRSKSTG